MIGHRHPNAHMSCPLDGLSGGFSSNYGTLITSLSVTGTTLVAGQIGGQLQFNGSSDYAFFDTGVIEDLGTADFTLCIRLTHDSQATSAMVITQANGVFPSWDVYIDTGGKLNCRIEVGATNYRLFTSTNAEIPTDGTSVSIIIPVSRSAGTVVPYKNAVAIAGSTASAGNITGSLDSTQQIQVGARQVSGSRLFYKGKIDELYIFKGLAFTPEEVKRFYTMQKAPMRRV